MPHAAWIDVLAVFVITVLLVIALRAINAGFLFAGRLLVLNYLEATPAGTFCRCCNSFNFGIKATHGSGCMIGQIEQALSDAGAFKFENQQ
jgi:hypothetical protein